MVPNYCSHNYFRFLAHELITSCQLINNKLIADCLFNDSGLPFLKNNALGSIIPLTTSNKRGN